MIKRELKFNDYKDCPLNNKVVLKSQQRFKSERHDIYTENVNKIALSNNDNKRLITFDKITTYPSLWIQRKECKRDLLKHLKYKMTNFDEYTNENKIEHNLKWPYIPDHPYRILIIGGSGSGKTNALLNLINNQPDIDKIYLYVKDPYEAKYQYLINKREKVGLDHFDDPKAFIEYSNDMQDTYKDIEDYNPKNNRKVLTVFDDMIADTINNKKLDSIVNELFIKGRKINISIVFITQSYFKVLRVVRLNTTHFFILKIPNKREVQQIASHQSSDIDFKDFMKIFRKYTAEPYSFLVNDTTLPSNDPLRFRKNLLG